MYSRFSPSFVEACLLRELRKGDKIPCPKCGKEDVKYVDPRRWAKVAGIIGLAAVGLLAARLTIPGQIVAIVAVGIAVAAFGTESSYNCRQCGYNWRFRDALKWALAIKHDQEVRAKVQLAREKPE